MVVVKILTGGSHHFASGVGPFAYLREPAFGHLHIGIISMMKPMISYMQKSELLFVFIVNLTPNSLNDLTSCASIRLTRRRFFWPGPGPDQSIICPVRRARGDRADLGVEQRHLQGTAEPAIPTRKIAKGLTPQPGLSPTCAHCPDIQLYQADRVPVGRDQKHHLEVARYIAERFNGAFCETFVCPNPKSARTWPRFPDCTSEEVQDLRQHHRDIHRAQASSTGHAIVTDSTPVEQPRIRTRCNLFATVRLFADKMNAAMRNATGPRPEIVTSRRTGGAYLNFLEPHREKRARLMEHPDDIRES